MYVPKRAEEPDMTTYMGVNISTALGSLFWGVLVSMILTGITVVQAYHYFPSKDRPIVQFVALSMLILDLLSCCLAAQSLYHYTLPNFGSTVPLERFTPTLAAECVATTFITVISQLYFAWQVFVLAQKPRVKYYASGAVVVFSLIAFAGGFGCSMVMFIHPTHILSARIGVFNKTAGIAKISAAIADIIVTSSLCFSLGYARTGIKATDSVIKTLIGFVIKRGVLVTLVQIAFLIVLFSSYSHIYWLAFHVNMTRLYAGTFFAMLNGREALKDELRIRCFSISGLGSYDPTKLDSSFRTSRLSKKGSDCSTDVEVPQSVWMDATKGGKSADTLGIGQIQVEKKIVVSDR